MLHYYSRHHRLRQSEDYFDMFDMEDLEAMRLSWNEIRAVEDLLARDENA